MPKLSDPYSIARERLEVLLEAAGLGCLGVASAAEARAALATMFFPIVVIDRMLPDSDGVELCHGVRRRAGEGGAPISCCCRELDSSDEIGKGLAAGADGYLSKRSSDAELLQQLKSACRHVRIPTKI